MHQEAAFQRFATSKFCILFLFHPIVFNYPNFLVSPISWVRGGSFSGGKVAGAWGWSPTSI